MARGYSPNGDADTAALARGVLAVGFEGSDRASVPLSDVRAFAPGAVLLFGRNIGAPDDVRELCEAMRGCGDVPPLIAIDQEGGSVARIRTGVAQLPSAMAIGATGDPALAESLGTLLGRDLARLGISVDLAPVADLASARPGGAIGTRAYSDDPEAVAAFAQRAARGLTRGGVLPALKHFPGHGATIEDSHRVLPRIAADAATLRHRDLLPFARVIASGAVSMVMTAHIVVEAFDAERPATLSPRVLGDLLRGELGFDGVIVTDCLEMDAIATTVGTVSGAVAALAAGADLLLISHHLDLARAAADAIVAAVDDGRIPLARLRDAHARVMAVRERYATLEPCADPLDDDLPREAARHAVTAVRGDLRLAAGKPVTVISFEDAGPSAAGVSGAARAHDAAPTLSGALRQRGIKSEHMRVARDPDGDDLALLLDVIARLGDREFVAVTRNAFASAAQRAAVERILALAPQTIVVAAALPHDALLWPAAMRVGCIYGDTPLALDGCADVLAGRAIATGHLPLTPAENVAVR
jgi:beta-N-acetylhexosaminidase